MTTARREFLGTLAVGAFAGPTLGSLPLDPALVQPAARGWDFGWAKKLTGKYRAVFDIPAIEDGYGVWRAAIWRRQYATIFNVPETSLNTVVVLRHDGIALALDNRFWTKYDIAKRWNVHDPASRQPFAKNPAIERTGAAALPGEFAGFTLEDLIKGGATVLGCSLALRDCAQLVMDKDKVRYEDAMAQVRQMVVPGVTMQPSGVFAVVLAQDNGCRFVLGS
ncbi:MAG: hypothetical protein FJ206_12660 [Gemmatimonadetes bacterium]|nr:hypothetical protein [Gemmatimonadota bacterium]